MKYSILAIAMVAMAMTSATFGATGSTSTGSTSTGSTSTGVVSTGSVAPVSNKGAGGILRMFNVTTGRFEMVDQCFPWAWLNDFYKGSIFMIYENQKACQKQRLIDFGI